MKNKLFVFGDSWANNYFSKTNKYALHLGSVDVEIYAKYYDFFGHWADHMSHFYDVECHARGGASNEEIFIQLGNLPDYNDGDRFIIIFSSPHRFNWFKNKRKHTFMLEAPNTILKSKYDKNIFNFMEEQSLEKYDWWIDSEIIKDEVKFIDRIKKVYEKWNPVLVSWSKELCKAVETVDFIELPWTGVTIWEESHRQLSDKHLGIKGNYILFQYLSGKLGLDISNYDFTPKEYKKKFL